MGQRKHHHNQNKRQKPRTGGGPAPLRAALPPFEKRIPVVYGRPFIILEDSQKGTFVFTGGQWIPHDRSIAECRLDCQVKALSQKINGMTRYEVALPVTADTE